MKSFLIFFFCVFQLVVVSVPQVQALSLQNLFDGDEIIIGDKLFSEWELVTSDGVDPNKIDVIPIENLPEIGLEYRAIDNELTAINEIKRLMFNFSISTLSGEPLIIGNSLEITEYTSQPNDSAIGIYGFSWEPFEATNVFVDTDSFNQLYDSVEFAPISSHSFQTFLYLGNNITLTAFEERFDQLPVPEPATIILLGTSLISLAGLGRKKLIG